MLVFNIIILIPMQCTCLHGEIFLSALVYGLLILASSLSVAEITIKSLMASDDLKHDNSTLPPDFANVIYAFRYFLHIVDNIALLVGVIKFHIFMKNGNVIQMCDMLKHITVTSGNLEYFCQQS